MKEDAKPKRNPMAAWTQVSGELMVITPENSVLHRFNETGTFIWQHLDGEHSLAEIAGLVAAEFEVSLEEANADVMEFVSKMLQDKLLAQ